MKYRFAGKEKILTFGPKTEVRIGETRDKRDAARAVFRDGHDPRTAKKLASAQEARHASNTFATLAEARPSTMTRCCVCPSSCA
jgi:hypothetical protein